MKYAYPKCLLTALVFLFFYQLQAQPGSTVDLKKPPQYENRKLASEKTETKKFGFGRRVYQNLVTHFNYYFNASNKLDEVVQTAKSSFKDDYTQLLPFYNYDLTTTSQSAEIDSIIYKCTAGVLLHDLRNDWVDNLYLLLGKAYFYRQNFDSAAVVFQYLNYAFAPKDDGYDIPIGSNASNDNGIFSIATVEKKDPLKKIVTGGPPSRNMGFLWMSRNYIEQGEYSTAAGILQVLQHDPKFPERLQTDLDETLALLYYKQKRYDSSAAHLSNALENAENRNERSRWEFLTAQMYQLANDSALALKFYDRSIEHAIDPVMEVYANLNSIKISGGDKDNVIQERLNNLLKLAKKDRYVLYRDIIYYAAAQMEMERGNTNGAAQMLKKSIAYSTQNPQQKTLSFLMLANIAYNNKQFMNAHNYYDSLEADLLTEANDPEVVTQRQTALKTIAENLTIIHLQDSLQALAKMPENDRNALLRKTLRQYRKAKGLKEDATPSSNPAVKLDNAPDLFTGSNADNSKGDWYFNNNSLKSKGFTEFRQKWGDRPNVDNWRLQSYISLAAAQPDEPSLDDAGDSVAGEQTPGSITENTTVADLAATLPTTEEQVKQSNELISKALFDNGTTFQTNLENYGAAIDSYQELNHRFDPNTYTEQALFNLYYCYSKVGDQMRADSCLALLKKNYSDGKWAQSLNNKTAPQTTSNNNPATKAYEDVYNLFISGKFEEAQQAKLQADSLYGNSYWTPQLLFIESIYYVSNKQDSAAIDHLNSLAEMYPTSPLAERAKTMVDVLKRRKEIENYLTSLDITRNEDEQGPVINLNPVGPTINKPEIKRDSIVSKTITQPKTIIIDTASAKPVEVKSFTYKPEQPQYIMILLNQVAPVFANEAKNAFDRYNKQTFYNQKINVSSVKLNDQYNLVLLGPFSNAVDALDYIDKTKPVVAGRILPWLTADKYNYSIISEDNLSLLKDNNDVEGYRKLVEKVLPGKFN